MKFSDKYNIDELLRTRTFAELNSSEKSFVLDQIESPEAYTQMRAVLLRVEKALKTDTLKAPAAMRADVMEAFDSQHSSDATRVVALWPTGKPWYRQNLVRIGIAAALIGIIWFVFPPSESQNDQLAERKEKPVQKPDEPKAAESILESDTTTDQEVKPSESEMIEDTEVPIPPKPAEIVEYTLSEELETTENKTTESLFAETKDSGTEELELSDEMEIEEESLDRNDFAQENKKSESIAASSYSSAEGNAPARSRLQQNKMAKEKKKSAPPPFRLSDQQDWMKNHYTAW